VDALRFVIVFLLVAVPIALALGYVLFLIFRIGFYLIFLVPVLAGLMTSAGVALAVRWGACRNRWIGGLAGLLAGCVMYLSYFHFDLLSLIGFRNVHHVELLPRWIYFRILTDKQKKVGAPDPVAGPQAAGNDPVKRVFKWIFFVLDSASAIVPPAAVGWYFATKPYCERRRRWMTTYNYRISNESGNDLAAAMSSGQTEGLDELIQTGPTVTPNVTTDLRFDYLPDVTDSSVYLSIVKIVSQGKNQPAKEHVQVNRILLTPEEADLLAVAVKLPRSGEATARPLPAKAILEGQVSGKIVPLPEEEAGKIASRRHIYTAVAIQVSPLILAVALAISGGWLAYAYWGQWAPLTTGIVLAYAIGLPVLLMIYLMCFEHYLPTKYYYACVQSVLRRRAESYVDPDDPDAIFIEMIPRANWSKLMAQNAKEVGLLKVDRQRQAILYEGDRERWIIPAESVVSCKIEEFTELNMEENRFNLHAVVVLVANVDGRGWEAPLCPRITTFRMWTAPVRRELARELNALIHRILPGQEVEEEPPRHSPHRPGRRYE
jgi:hypothetical protein